MPRTPRSRRTKMGDRLAEAAEEAVGINPGEAATEAQMQGYTELLREAGHDPEGEVLGAGTGRARRAIQAERLDQIRWDPSVEYPQIDTRSTNPERPRTIAAGYDPNNSIIRVTFRNGVTYEYLGPSRQQWESFRRAPSPGRYIDDILDQYPYRPVEE